MRNWRNWFRTCSSVSTAPGSVKSYCSIFRLIQHLERYALGFQASAYLAKVWDAPGKPIGRQIFTRFRLNRSAGRACATDAQAITTEVGGHVESLCCRSCCFRSFCRVLQPTQYLACALFDVDVDGTSLRLPLSLDGSRSQPSPYEFCLGCK
jgi:hypothetical protein